MALTRVDRTPMEKASANFFALLNAKKLADRNGTAGPSRDALVASAAGLLLQVEESLPTGGPGPAPEDPLPELDAAVSMLDELIRELATEINRGADQFDPKKVSALLEQMQKAVDEQAAETERATAPRRPGASPRVEHVPPEVSESIVACAISAITAEPYKFARRTDLAQAAGFQRQFAESLIARGRDELANVRPVYDGFGARLR